MKPHKPKNRICSAHSSRTGLPCKRYAISGGEVCPSHGGRAPNVLKAAKRRLLEAVDPAAAELVRIALGETRLARVLADGTKVDEAPGPEVRVRAIREILDRAGLPRLTKLEHSGVMGGADSVLVDAALKNPRARAALTELVDAIDYDEDDTPAE